MYRLPRYLRSRINQRGLIGLDLELLRWPHVLLLDDPDHLTVKKVYMLRCFIISYLAASREHDIAALTSLMDCIVLIRYL